MAGFSAVVTTGIYCRPGCSARPSAENVRAFPFAAAAEAAGFRACHRCRPYRWPQSYGWTAPELVCRAVSLILDGMLDDGSETDLGSRLGVSPRHLRRLFKRTWESPPTGWRARPGRISRGGCSTTPISRSLEIAYAAGFGSLRQFNRACREVFRESPRELRARRRKADHLVADGGLLLRLPFSGPLDWDTMAAYFAARAIPGVEQVSGDTYRRTIVVGDDPGVLELSSGGDDHLLLRAHLPHWEELVHVVQSSRRIASLDFELNEPASHLAGDPTIGPLLEARPGLRPPGTWDPFETGVRAIIGQQVTLAHANAIAGRLVQRLGTEVPGLEPLGLTHTFPSAATLAGADLGGLGLTPARARAVGFFAGAVAADTVRLDRSIGLDRLDRLDHRPRRPRPLDRSLSRPPARRAGRLPDHRPRPSTIPSPARAASGCRARRPRRALAAVARARRDTPLDSRPGSGRPRAPRRVSAGRSGAIHSGRQLSVSRTPASR